MADFYRKLNKKLSGLESDFRKRSLKNIADIKGNYIEIDGEKYLNFSSNDYLGIANDIDIKKEFLDWLGKNAHSFTTNFSSSSSRLLSGNTTVYEKTEQTIADFYRKEVSLIFSSGYHMNTGFFPAMYEKGDIILADKLVHASIIDGIKLSRADHFRFRHLDLDHLRNILLKKRGAYKNGVIVTESIFSMDGDIANISGLAELAEEFDMQLFVDEAHAVGCIGNRGLGLCEVTDTIDRVDFIAGTFGKGLGGAGAFIVCREEVKSMLVNKCRSLIFTTALPPVNIKWIDFILSKSVKMTKKRELLAQNSAFFRKKISESGYETIGEKHIVPLICGEDATVLTFSERMLKSGIFVPSIRPPTVAEGSSRLRFSVTSTFTVDELESVTKVLKGIEV